MPQYAGSAIWTTDPVARIRIGAGFLVEGARACVGALWVSWLRGYRVGRGSTASTSCGARSGANGVVDMRR
jgi:hypothetical protein